MLSLGRTYHNYMKPQVKEIQMTEAVLETETAERQVGLRLSQAYFGFAMGLALVFGFVCSPHMFAYDISMVRVLVLMAGGMGTLWLMSQRARSARWIGAATALLFAGLAAIDHAAFGALDTLAIYIGQPITTAIMYAEYAGAVAPWEQYKLRPEELKEAQAQESAPEDSQAAQAQQETPAVTQESNK